MHRGRSHWPSTTRVPWATSKGSPESGTIGAGSGDLPAREEHGVREGRVIRAKGRGAVLALKVKAHVELGDPLQAIHAPEDFREGNKRVGGETA